MKIGFLPLFVTIAPAVLWPQSAYRPDIPKTWDEAALADWVTPLAGLNARPTHISAKEYYEMPEYNLRSYPVYMPGREPGGYWEMLQHIGPKPLIEFGTLKTEADWIEAGKRVFEEATLPQKTTFDPELIAKFRSREYLEQQRVRPKPDGALDLLWTSAGSLPAGAWPFRGGETAMAATSCADPTAPASTARRGAPKSPVLGPCSRTGLMPSRRLRIMWSGELRRSSWAAES